MKKRNLLDKLRYHYLKKQRNKKYPKKEEVSKAEKYSNIGMKVITFGFGGAILWAATAPIDKGVSVPGWIITEGQRKSVQHQTGGLVEKIMVKEGDHVHQGDVLIKLNQVNPEANAKAIEAIVAQLGHKMEMLEKSTKSKRQQIGSIGKQISNLRPLTKDGHYPVNRLLELERSLNQIENSLISEIGDLNQTKKQIDEQQARLAPHTYELEMTEIKAPISGDVINLQVFTEGGVIQQGQKIMDIVPKHLPLVAEGQVPVHLVDKIKVGMPIEMVFSALNQNTTPHIPGKLIMVGEDRIIDEKTGEPHYKVLAEVTPEGMIMLNDNVIKAGMPVEMFIITGERTVLSYIFKPIMDRAYSSMRED